MLSFVANTVTIALSISSHVILSLIQQVFIKYLLCVLFTVYFMDDLRQLINEHVMTQMWVCPSRNLSPSN